MTTAWDHEPTARELGIAGGDETAETPGHGHVTPRPDGSKARCGGPALCSACRAEESTLTVTQRRHDGTEVARAEAPRCTATLPDPKGSGLAMRCERPAAHNDTDGADPLHDGVTSLGGEWHWHDAADGARRHTPAPQPARPEALEHTLPDPEVTNTRTHDHRTFRLVRDADPTGVSGLGVVAEGVQFSDGRVALRWIGAQGKPSTACWDSLADMLVVHGHQGATRVEWT